MATIKKMRPAEDQANPELIGTLGMTAGGVAAGIAAGAAAGAAVGGLGGPIGVVAGAAVGGAIGGAAAERAAHSYNVVEEETYWEQNYRERPYVEEGHDFDRYRSAYRYGAESYSINPEQSFEDLEPSLRNNWNIARGKSTMEWNEAREAARDAFERLSDRESSRRMK